jgi:hypothetical protein
MYTENIIRDLLDLIHDVKAAGGRAYDNHKDADRTLTLVLNECAGYQKAYRTTFDGMVDASQALDKANDDFLNIEEMLKKVVEDIKMEELSHKVQSK